MFNSILDKMERYLAEEALKLAEEKYESARQRWREAAEVLEREEMYMDSLEKSMVRLRRMLDS